MGQPLILFVVDAGPGVGGGHVMRSLTLARALQALGARCAFLASPALPEVLAVFGPDIEQRTEPGDFDGLVFDHYGLSRDDHEAFARGRPVLVIDDLADRPLAADIVVDSGPTRTADDYRNLLPSGAQMLLGPAYAPVRREFAAMRAEALARRAGPLRRVLISMGLTDEGGMTLRVIEALAPYRGEFAIDIVVGGGAESLPALRRLAAGDPSLALHVDTRAMAELMARADAGVGAAGSTTWERCTLGLPSILVMVADNQRPAAGAMAERGAALVVDAADADFVAALDRALKLLLDDPARRAGLAAASARVCDGLGAGRVAAAFLDLISLRARPA